MKTILSLIGIFLTTMSFGQNSNHETIDLIWKISPDEIVNYRTIMQEITADSATFNFGNFLNSINDNTQTSFDKFEKLLNQTAPEMYLVSQLTQNPKGHIDVKMINIPKEVDNTSGKDSLELQMQVMFNKMSEMNQGIVLEGALEKSGKIQSFWLKNSQKNLLAMFFELPENPVRVGDSWPLNVNIIANDSNFKCEESNKTNSVKLIDIIENESDKVAILQYNIEEYVKGNMVIFGSKTPTMMKYNFAGKAEFSITNGRWNSFNAILLTESEGFMGRKSISNYSLIKE